MQYSVLGNFFGTGNENQVLSILGLVERLHLLLMFGCRKLNRRYGTGKVEHGQKSSKSSDP